MKRTLYKKLITWKADIHRKPLILSGARQTGKTYLLLKFGKTEFRKIHYLDFQKNISLHSIFDENLDAKHIVGILEFVLNETIDINKDIVFFDEIQDCPRALTSLKYFNEDMPQLAIVCAGSLLGVVHSSASFPVGKVNFLNLYPMAFIEFLEALGEDRAVGILTTLDLSSEISTYVHEHLLRLLKEYMVVGGMPEIVNFYRSSRDRRFAALQEVRHRQEELLSAYMGDFSKYSGSTKAKDIVTVYESIPQQLAKEYKKYIPSQVMQGGRFSKLKDAIDWLSGAGLVHKVFITNSAEIPFASFTKENRFKLYFFDIGMLGALGQILPEEIMLQNNQFATFKGAFCENLVAQEFIYADGKPLFAWASNTSEVEFIKDVRGKVYPIEVKAGLSGKLKSLNVFAQKYHSPYRTRISSRNFEINQETHMHSYPLYLTYRFPLES